MRGLQICHKPPLPSVDGGCIAINNISKGLINQLGSIKILTIGTLKHPFNMKYYEDNFINRTSIESAFVDTKLNIVDAFSNLDGLNLDYSVNNFSTNFYLISKKKRPAFCRSFLCV